MKKVDEVYPLDINATIGPSGTIKRLFRNKDYFAQRGYELSVLVNHPIKKRFLFYKYALRPLTTLPGDHDCDIMSDSINTVLWKSNLKSHIKKIIENSKWLSSLRFSKGQRTDRKSIESYINNNREADIIIFHVVNSAYYYHKLIKGDSAKTALFIHADGSDSGMFVKSYPLLEGTKCHERMLKHYDYAIHNVNRVVFISDLARQRFCEAHPDCASKAIAILNGIDDITPVIVNPSSKHKYRLVCTGSVCERKGQYIVVEAMHRMRPDILDETHFTIIGTGPDHSLLVNRVKEYGLENNVSFVGNIPNKDVPQYLATENIYILMSNNEGLPISILEAMRSGLPIISTPVAGIPEEVNEKNGILVNPDVEQLTGILNRLQDYDWSLLGKNSRTRFEQEFTFEIMRKHYGDLFDELSDTK